VELKKMRFSRRPGEDTGLLRMTNWVAEIATSLNQNTVDLLAMKEQEKTQIPLTPFSKGGTFFLTPRWERFRLRG